MRRRLGLGLLPLLLAGALGAEDGGQAAAWTKGALGARSAALGQALGALADDPDAALLNPALIATQQRANLGDQAALLPDGSQLHHLGWARPFWTGSRMGWSLAYAQYTVGQPLERRRGNSGEPDSRFNESASLTQLGLGGWLLEGSVALGLNLKAYSHALGDAQGGGAAGDLGLYWRSRDWLGFGLTARDVASRLAWGSGAVETLPLRLRAATHMQLLDARLGLLGELEGSQQQALRLRAGLEAWAWPRRLALRAGLDRGQAAGGLGLRWPWRGYGLGLDYALNFDAQGGSALQHRFSFTLGIPL